MNRKLIVPAAALAALSGGYIAFHPGVAFAATPMARTAAATSLQQGDFTVDPAHLNAWNDPNVSNEVAVAENLKFGSLYGSPDRVREQVAELRDVGVRHLLCQTGFGAMSHERNIASMRRFGEQVMPVFRQQAAEEPKMRRLA